MNSSKVQSPQHSLRLSYVFDSVLASMYKVCSRVSEALLLASLTLSLTNRSFSDSKAFHCVLMLPNSSTPSIACTTVLNCGHTFLNRL